MQAINTDVSGVKNKKTSNNVATTKPATTTSNNNVQKESLATKVNNFLNKYFTKEGVDSLPEDSTWKKISTAFDNSGFADSGASMNPDSVNLKGVDYGQLRNATESYLDTKYDEGYKKAVAKYNTAISDGDYLSDRTNEDLTNENNNLGTMIDTYSSLGDTKKVQELTDQVNYNKKIMADRVSVKNYEDYQNVMQFGTDADKEYATKLLASNEFSVFTNVIQALDSDAEKNEARVYETLYAIDRGFEDALNSISNKSDLDKANALNDVTENYALASAHELAMERINESDQDMALSLQGTDGLQYLANKYVFGNFNQLVGQAVSTLIFPPGRAFISGGVTYADTLLRRQQQGYTYEQANASAIGTAVIATTSAVVGQHIIQNALSLPTGVTTNNVLFELAKKATDSEIASKMIVVGVQGTINEAVKNLAIAGINTEALTEEDVTKEEKLNAFLTNVWNDGNFMWDLCINLLLDEAQTFIGAKSIVNANNAKMQQFSDNLDDVVNGKYKVVREEGESGVYSTYLVDGKKLKISSEKDYNSVKEFRDALINNSTREYADSTMDIVTSLDKMMKDYEGSRTALSMGVKMSSDTPDIDFASLQTNPVTIYTASGAMFDEAEIANDIKGKLAVANELKNDYAFQGLNGTGLENIINPNNFFNLSTYSQNKVINSSDAIVRTANFVNSASYQDYVSRGTITNDTPQEHINEIMDLDEEAKQIKDTLWQPSQDKTVSRVVDDLGLETVEASNPNIDYSQLGNVIINPDSKSAESAVAKVFRKRHDPDNPMPYYSLDNIKDANRFSVQVTNLDDLNRYIDYFIDNYDAKLEVMQKKDSGYTGFHLTFENEDGLITECQITMDYNTKLKSDEAYDSTRDLKDTEENKKLTQARNAESVSLWDDYRNRFGLTPEVIDSIRSKETVLPTTGAGYGSEMSIQPLSGLNTSTTNPSSSKYNSPSSSVNNSNLSSSIDNLPPIDNSMLPNIGEISSNEENNLTNVNVNDNNSGNHYATIAPYYDVELTPENRNELVNKAKDAFLNNANVISNALGFGDVTSIDNIGGYTFDEGGSTVEPSWTFALDNATEEQGRMFAMLMGDLGFENQETVVHGRYVPVDYDGDDAIVEIDIKHNLGDKDAVVKAIKDAGIDDFTSNENGISVLDFGDEGLTDKLEKLYNNLGENYEGTEYKKIKSELIDREARRTAYENELAKASGNTGEGFDSSDATQRLYQEAINSLNVAEGRTTIAQDAQSREQRLTNANNLRPQNRPFNLQDVVNGNYFDYGFNPVREKNIPRETSYGPTAQATRTIANSPFVSDDVANRMEQEAYKGEYAYERTTNVADTNRAIKKIKELGYEKSIQYVLNEDRVGNLKVSIAMGRELLKEMERRGEDASELAFKLRKKLSTTGSLIGQAEQAYATFKTMDPKQQIITIQDEVDRIQNELKERWGKRAPELKVEEGLIERFIGAKTQEERDAISAELAQAIADQIPPTVMERMNGYRHLSMLFNPRTWIKNAVANTAFGYVSDVKRATQTLIEGMIAQKYSDGQRKAGIYNPLDADYKKTYKTLVEDYNANYKDFQGKYTSSDFGDIVGTSEFGKLVSSKRKQFKSNFMNSVSDINSKFMSDAPAMRKAYAHTIIGYLNTNKTTWDALDETAKQELRDYAFNQAREITFNAESKLANNISKFANTNTASKIIVDSFIPFKRTPINILKQGVKYSPAQLGKSIWDYFTKLKTGKITATEFADGLASGLTGTGIVLLGALLGHMGIIRTNDEDPDRKKYFDQENGEQDYSIVTENGSYTIDWLDPIIMPLSIGVELANDKKIESVDDMIDVATSIMDPVFETSMLSGITKNLQGYKDGSAYVGQLAQNALSNYISQYFPSILGATARTIDDTRRTTYPNDGFIDKTTKTLLNKVPGASSLNEPYINKQGEEEKTEDLGIGTAGRAILNFLSPGYYSSKDIDEYDEELYRLYNKTGEISALPSDTTTQVQYDKEYYKLSDKEYTQWNKTRMSKETEYVNDFIDSDVYDSYEDSEKVAIIGKIREYAGMVAKEEMLKNKGIKYESKEYENIKGAVDSGLDLYKYFKTTSVYDSLEGDNKKTDYISYLEGLDADDEAKNYLYDKYYGTSKMTQHVNEMDLDDSEKLAIKVANTVAEGIKDENGKSIANSKALAVADAYADAGLLDDVFAYIEENGIKPTEMGLSKTVYGYSYSQLASEYERLFGEPFGNGESFDTGSTTTTTTKKSTSTKTGKQITGGTTTTTSGTTKTTNSNLDYDNAYSSIMGTVKSGGKKNYGSSSAKSSEGGTTYCPKCGQNVVPVNGICPVCGYHF